MEAKRNPLRLIQAGHQLKAEQQQVEARRLSEEYLGLKRSSSQEAPPAFLPSPPPAAAHSLEPAPVSLSPDVQAHIRRKDTRSRWSTRIRAATGFIPGRSVELPT